MYIGVTTKCWPWLHDGLQGTTTGPCIAGVSITLELQWIGLGENLQESPIFHRKIDGFRFPVKISLPIHWGQFHIAGEESLFLWVNHGMLTLRLKQALLEFVALFKESQHIPDSKKDLVDDLVIQRKTSPKKHLQMGGSSWWTHWKTLHKKSSTRRIHVLVDDLMIRDQS